MTNKLATSSVNNLRVSPFRKRNCPVGAKFVCFPEICPKPVLLPEKFTTYGRVYNLCLRRPYKKALSLFHHSDSLYLIDVVLNFLHVDYIKLILKLQAKE
jgi:hypothetical protein